eukprot:9109023-Prorocentrum_lima.AAC.1
MYEMTVTSSPSRPDATGQSLDTRVREGLRAPSMSESSGATAMLNMIVASGSPWSMPVVEEKTCAVP